MEVVILAAGKGTRMNSAQPKVLHQIGGKPTLSHVIHAATHLDPGAIHVVVGFGAEQVAESILKMGLDERHELPVWIGRTRFMSNRLDGVPNWDT